MDLSAREPILVVDVGTETTMAHLVTSGTGDAPAVEDPGFDKDYWPTALAREGDGFVAGFAAQIPGTEQGLARGQFLRAAAGGAVPGGLVTLEGTAHAREDLLGEFLRQIRHRGNRQPPGDVHRLLLTIPDACAHDDVARRSWLRAARIAGFTHVELLPAAVAVALHGERGGRVLVCDAGASALRLTLVRAGTADGMAPGSVLGTVAIAGFGGDALDEAMAADLAKKSQATGRLSLRRARGGQAPRGDEFLRDVADYRKLLSSQEQVTFSTVGQAPVSYRRDDLKRLLDGRLGQLREAYAELLRTAMPSRTGAAEVGDVLLVGGCAATPCLAGQLKDALRLRVTPQPQYAPDFAIVRGGESWARHAPGRRIAALPHRPGTRSLAWNFKDGGTAHLITWLVPEGRWFSAGARVAVARGGEDDIHYLTAGFSGVMRKHCVPEKKIVNSGQVLAVAETPATGRATQPCWVDDLPGAAPLSFSPDGTELLVGRHGRYQLHHLESSAERDVRWSAPPGLGRGVPGGFQSDVACGDATGWLAGVVHGGTITVYGAGTGRSRPLGRYGKDDDPLIRLSADGLRACVADHDGLRVRTVPDGGKPLISAGKPALYGEAASSVVYSRDGGTMLIALRGVAKRRRGRDVPPRLEAWYPGAAAGALVCALPSAQQGALCLAVSHDGGFVLIGGLDGELKLYQAGGGLDGEPRRFQADGGHLLWKSPVAGTQVAAEFSPDGMLLATVHQQGGRWWARIWDVTGHSRLFKWELARPATRILFSPELRYLVTGDDQDSIIWGLFP
jgi:hypothetical protein